MPNRLLHQEPGPQHKMHDGGDGAAEVGCMLGQAVCAQAADDLHFTVHVHVTSQNHSKTS